MLRLRCERSHKAQMMLDNCLNNDQTFFHTCLKLEYSDHDFVYTRLRRDHLVLKVCTYHPRREQQSKLHVSININEEECEKTNCQSWTLGMSCH